MIHYCIYLVAICALCGSIPIKTPINYNGVSHINETHQDGIDVALYSRQLLVYGSSAQQKLQNSHVLLYNSGQLAIEILKNLALAGVGKISILENENVRGRGRISLVDQEDSLMSYGQSLNPQLQVSYFRIVKKLVI
jgi:hypothetical protein